MHTFEFRLNRLIITRAHVYPIVSNKSLSYSSLLYLHFFSHISEGIYIYTSMYIFMCIYIRIHSLVTLSLSCSLSIFLSLSHTTTATTSKQVRRAVCLDVCALVLTWVHVHFASGSCFLHAFFSLSRWLYLIILRRLTKTIVVPRSFSCVYIVQTSMQIRRNHGTSEREKEKEKENALWQYCVSILFFAFFFFE